MMRYIVSVIFCFFSFAMFAHNADDTLVLVQDDTSHIRISILTCGVGDELYSSFGHTGVRVIDSVHHTDDVYNYGTFDFGDPHFYKKFVLGKLPYYLDKGSYNDFMYTYIEEKRNVEEQVMNLSAVHKLKILAYLENNLKPENRAYKYDFMWDNCCTRVRDIFPKVLGEEFYFGDILTGKKITYRNIINQYLMNKHWERFGIDLLLGSRIDSTMSEDGVMFLPDFLHKGLEHAKYKNEHIVGSDQVILAHKHIYQSTLNGPLWTMIGILILTVLAFLIPAFHYLKSFMRFVLLFITGLLGLFILFMWLGTDNQGCSDNYNILWALPLNAFAAFFAHKQSFWLRIYALAAISLLIVALIVHLIGFQQMPLIEISPLLLAMMYVYVDMYKRNVPAPKANKD
ncbi:DUF4105 domain-containing protein [Taibaiella lutea]|uniref:DUF4105 domain-containing protein n=1 Tax=Taibaiella lutea TaxID=2608001 RepID=A0A5M6CTK5_9BACT|nr:DUF4105 domain-containing protein [Taibaiella lutea]KAA5537292.1 DUF4105 domain-containing protein [Taibaiella lutea]